MAQSRPPPVRVHTSTTSPPPLSPRTQNGEKRHHSRRKSGRTEHASDKKSSRPSTLTRKATPQYVTKSSSTGRSHGHRDREEEERGRDSGESFPQFCMSCEKQFLPANDTFLYCSEACRIHDLEPSPIRTNSYSSISHQASYSPPLTPYTRTFDDGPDIIPRFSPTQSRPRSYFASEPYPSSYHHQDPHPLSSSTPYHTSRSYSSEKPSAVRTNSTALESLRELATALPPTSSSRRRDEDHAHSPPKSTTSSITRNGSSTSVWGYIPFTSSKNSTPAVTPGNSYTNSTSHYPYTQSQSYSVQHQSAYGTGHGYLAGETSREDVSSYGYAKSQGTSTAGYYGGTGGMGMDRPLPPRSGPGGYGHRPKSIDLVTPYGGH